TALAESLLDEAAARGCVVLRGACREHESVTYNAFDALVDSAAALLQRRLDKGGLARQSLAGSPTGLAQPARPVPVVRELSFGEPATNPNGAVDRERAFAACRKLVERATSERNLVLFLDDLHWADEDSLQLLGHLLQPGIPGLFVLGTAWPPDGPPE